jgi:hypothetical protein
MRREPTTADELFRNFVAAAAVLGAVYGLAFIAAIVTRLL